MSIKFSRIREVKLPTRGTSESAGMDVYVPKYSKEFLSDFKEMGNNEHLTSTEKGFYIHPQESVLLPTGLKVNFDEYAKSIGKKLMLGVKNKSGVGSKKLLSKLAEIIDQDYQGEIFINLVNTGLNTQFIQWGDEKSISQLILQEYFAPEIEEVPVEELWSEKTERGEGSRGSTNKK